MPRAHAKSVKKIPTKVAAEDMLLHIWTCDLFRKIYASYDKAQVLNPNKLMKKSSHATSDTQIQAVFKETMPLPNDHATQVVDPNMASESNKFSNVKEASVRKELMSNEMETLISLSTVGVPVWDKSYFIDDNAESGSSMTSQYCGTNVPTGLALAVAESSTVDGTTCGHDHGVAAVLNAKMEQAPAPAPPLEQSIVDKAAVQDQELTEKFQCG